MSESRLRAAILALALLGAAIAAYLTYVHYRPSALSCTTGGCETVQQSRYATMLGIPVAALGLAAYLMVGVSALLESEFARLGGAVVLAASVLFALYLVYVQADLVHAWCEWCLASDAVFATLAALTVVRATRANRASPS